MPIADRLGVAPSTVHTVLRRCRLNRATTAGKPRNRHHNLVIGTAFVHTVLDDHSRMADVRIHDVEIATTGMPPPGRPGVSPG